MQLKQLLGLILLSLGVVLIVLALHKMGYIEPRVLQTKVITNSPVAPTERLPEPSAVIVDRPDEGNAKVILVAGMVMVIVGGIVAIRYKK